MRKTFILLFALLLVGCAGQHRAPKPTLELSGLEQAEFTQADGERLVLHGQTYIAVPTEEGPGDGLFLPEYGGKLAAPGEVSAYRLMDHHYLYFAEIKGMPGWLVSGWDDGSGRITKENRERYYKTADAETPEWVAAYRDDVYSQGKAPAASDSDLNETKHPPE